MFSSWMKHMRKNTQQNAESNNAQQQTQSENIEDPAKNAGGTDNFITEILPTVKGNISNFKNLLGDPNDLTTREFKFGESSYEAAIMYIDGLVDQDMLQDFILKNLQIDARQAVKSGQDPEKLLDEIFQRLVSVTEISKEKSMDKVSLAILYGDSAFFLEGCTTVLIIGSKGYKTRSIEEPVTEAVIRGPREGFIENIRTNTMLIRRQIRDPNLRFKTHFIGRRAKKILVVAYLDGIVNKDLLKEVNRRLSSIDTDDVTESGIVEQWIEDSFLSPFPQVQHTERPDRVCAGIISGKIAILLDGTPFVLIVPYTFADTMQSPEDYYERWIIGSLIRVLRYIAAFIAVFLPSLYVALVSYHQGMIPSKLAFSIAATREGVPFPAFIEAMIMAITMELLREAGIRLPKPIGQTIGIVGGLVIGDAAVAAGIVSPIMVIVVAVTAIASFSLPSYSVAISLRMLRFAFMVAAAVFGLYGIILMYIMLNIHIVNLKSFGVPYSAPFAPSFLRDFGDLVIRAPLTMEKTRPGLLQTNDDISLDKGNKGGKKG